MNLVGSHMVRGLFSLPYLLEMINMECLPPCKLGNQNIGSQYQHGFGRRWVFPHCKRLDLFFNSECQLALKNQNKHFKSIQAGTVSLEISLNAHSIFNIFLTYA